MQCYLDVSPMIRALWEAPETFETDGYFVYHRPSRHWLRFDAQGNARIAARCNCAELPVSREQSDLLRAAIAVWQQTYWRPLLAREAAERRVAEINRAFAKHFRPRSRLRRVFDAVCSILGVDGRTPPKRIGLSPPRYVGLPVRPAPATRKQQQEELLSA